MRCACRGGVGRQVWCDLSPGPFPPGKGNLVLVRRQAPLPCWKAVRCACRGGVGRQVWCDLSPGPFPPGKGNLVLVRRQAPLPRWKAVRCACRRGAGGRSGATYPLAHLLQDCCFMKIQQPWRFKVCCMPVMASNLHRITCRLSPGFPEFINSLWYKGGRQQADRLGKVTFYKSVAWDSPGVINDVRINPTRRFG